MLSEPVAVVLVLLFAPGLALVFHLWEHFTGKPFILRKFERPPEITVEFDDFAVTKRRGDEIIEEFWWDQLVKVQINTVWCPGQEDFFYLLWGETEEQDMLVSLGQAVESGLGEHIASFPDFDAEEHGMALRTTWDEQFIIWEREDTGGRS